MTPQDARDVIDDRTGESYSDDVYAEALAVLEAAGWE